MRTAGFQGALLGLLACWPSGSARAAPTPDADAPQTAVSRPAEQRLELEVLSDPERVRVRVHTDQGEPARLLVGDPWHGGASFDPLVPARRVLPPADPARAANWDLPIAAEAVRAGVYEVEVPGAGFGAQPVAVQAIGVGARLLGAPRWVSAALVLERQDGELRVREYASYARARSSSRAFGFTAALCGAAALYCGARAWTRRTRRGSAARMRTSRAPRLELALGALCALTALGARCASSASLPEVLGGARPLPLVWPSEWPLVGPRAPLALGVDFAELRAALDRELQPGESLCVLYAGAGSDGSGILRFAHLADLYPGLRVLLRGQQRLEPGLYVCIDFEPDEPALWTCSAGTLLRVARVTDT
jgi:hypothetical protein